MADQPTLTWEEVAQRYGRKIYTFAYRLTGNPDDAADLVQEVLLRVRKGLASYTPGSFDGWLWRITRNAFLDGVRKKKRRPTQPFPEGDSFAFGASPSPDEVLASVRLSDDVQSALLKLPYDFREAVVLCDVVGLTYDEIADATDVPLRTAVAIAAGAAAVSTMFALTPLGDGPDPTAVSIVDLESRHVAVSSGGGTPTGVLVTSP